MFCLILQIQNYWSRATDPVLLIPCYRSHATDPMLLIPCYWSHATDPVLLIPCYWSHATDPMLPIPCYRSHATDPMLLNILNYFTCNTEEKMNTNFKLLIGKHLAPFTYFLLFGNGLSKNSIWNANFRRGKSLSNEHEGNFLVSLV